MQYFDKPKPVLLRKLINQNTGKPGVDLPFEDLLEQMVFILPIWRSSKDYLEASKRLRTAIESAKEGGEIEARDSDHEKLVQSLQQLDLNGKSHLVEAVSDFTYAVMCTNTKPSEKVVEASPAN